MPIHSLEKSIPDTVAIHPYITLQRLTEEPTTPASGLIKLFADTEGRIFTKDSSGTVTEIGAIGPEGDVVYFENWADLTGWTLFYDGTPNQKAVVDNGQMHFCVPVGSDGGDWHTIISNAEVLAGKTYTTKVYIDRLTFLNGGRFTSPDEPTLTIGLTNFNGGQCFFGFDVWYDATNKISLSSTRFQGGSGEGLIYKTNISMDTDYWVEFKIQITAGSSVNLYYKDRDDNADWIPAMLQNTFGLALYPFSEYPALLIEGIGASWEGDSPAWKIDPIVVS